jgi:hypothetical protein
MHKTPPSSEYLVLSRGQWDERLSPEEIQAAIDDFYVWHGRLVDEGTMRPGSRLMREGKRVSRHAVVDGPFSESKEIIGGYWHVLAGSLDEAAAIMARNPTLACGLEFEIRPLDPERASAYVAGNETPTTSAGGLERATRR